MSARVWATVMLIAACGESGESGEARTVTAPTTPVSTAGETPEPPEGAAADDVPVEEPAGGGDEDPAAATEPPDRDALLGAWQDLPEVGSGYTGLLFFFPDGTFVEWVPGACRRYVSERRGDFALEGATLAVTERMRVEVLGGRAVRDEATCYWEDERTRRVDVPSPRARDVVLAGCTDEERDSGAGRCARFDGEPRWRIAGEGTARTEILPELGLGAE